MAYAAVLVSGKEPCHCVFQQGAMRQHPIACLECGVITEFKLRRFRTARKGVLGTVRHDVQCVCRGVYQKRRDQMVECQFCFVWFHTSCVQKQALVSIAKQAEAVQVPFVLLLVA